jgi:hypothetical protein
MIRGPELQADRWRLSWAIISRAPSAALICVAFERSTPSQSSLCAARLTQLACASGFIDMTCRRTALFVHGCFWHQHEGCRLSRQPKSRPEYWHPKLRRNQERDGQVATLLADLGWNVVTVWECETADPAIIERRLREIADRVTVTPP